MELPSARQKLRPLCAKPEEADDVVGRLQQAVAENPNTVIYLAADERGQTDRLPMFLELYDRLAFAGLDIKLVGRPSSDGENSGPSNDSP